MGFLSTKNVCNSQKEHKLREVQRSQPERRPLYLHTTDPSWLLSKNSCIHSLPTPLPDPPDENHQELMKTAERESSHRKCAFPLLSPQANPNTPEKEEREKREVSFLPPPTLRPDQCLGEMRVELKWEWKGSPRGCLISESGKKPKGSDTDISKAHKGGNCHSILKEVIDRKNKFVFYPTAPM